MHITARVVHHGSIPACAGEPPTHTPSVVPLRVYPRVCGGTSRHLGLECLRSGLSPRVRGNPRPARVCGRVRRVYPRVCGGTSVRQAIRSRLRGLSPRVRGNPSDHLQAIVTKGSIPACAGEPSKSSSSRSGQRVYPRVCGGTNDRAGGFCAIQGLSPRVRGNRTT